MYRQSGLTYAEYKRTYLKGIQEGTMDYLTNEKNLLNPAFLETIQDKAVYIVGPGPNGRDHWSDIPDDSTVIFINKAIELLHTDSVKCSNALWLVCETSVIQTEWFAIHRDAYGDILCAGRAVVDIGGLEDHEYFKVFDYYGRAEVDAVIDVHDGSLSIGTTIAGMAIQLGWHMLADYITLCGIDLYGDKYYDGDCGHYDGREDKPWGMYANRIGRLIDRMNEKRFVIVESLSKTEINVERVA